MKKRILIDVDDVIIQEHWFDFINIYLTETLGREPIESLEGRPRFYEDEFLSKQEKSDFRDFFYAQDGYKYAKPIDGAIEAVKKLNEKHDVYLVTSVLSHKRLVPSARHFTDKLIWLINNMPFFDPMKYIASSQKHINIADVMIDDVIDNLKGEFKTKILFSAYHNRNISDLELRERGIVRANSWKEVLDIVG